MVGLSRINDGYPTCEVARKSSYGDKGGFLAKSKVQTILRLLILRIFEIRFRSEESASGISTFDLTLNIISFLRNVSV